MTTKRVAISLVMILLLGIGTAHAAPKLAMPDTLYDFGFVPQNAHISHIFWLKSAGTDTLKILKVTPGCGCTQGTLDKEAIAPNDSTRLEIIFNSGQYNGSVMKEPRVTVNDSTVGERMIYFKANIVARPDSTYPVIISPYKLDISQFGEKPRAEIRFTIHNSSTQAVTPTLVGNAPDYFQIDLPKSIGGGATESGTLHLSKEAMTKEFEKSFTFQLNDERQSRFTVPVKRSIHALQSSTTPATTPATQTSAH